VTFAAADAVVRAVLYEGYSLYPYRPTSLKNRQRWTFGGLYAKGAGGAAAMSTQCLVEGADAGIEVRIRFLHLGVRAGREEAVEREVRVTAASVRALETPHETPFLFEPSPDLHQQSVRGVVKVHTERLGGVHRLTVLVENTSEAHEACVLASTHILIHVSGGELHSLIDPPERLQQETATCTQMGCWPVLVGEDGARTLLLASPVILYDYPKIAPESPGDLFDATEIDEILTLRILTLTEDEKAAARKSDDRIKALIDRTDALTAEDLSRLHGALRRTTRSSPTRFRAGDRVRLAPKGRADAFDTLLAGRAATVVSVETDFEGTEYVTVTIDDDPGRDLGVTGQPGHRFFFRLDEVEAL
jgi:hypothetical protein